MGIRSYPNKPRIYVDMDGVVADFERAMREQGKTAKEIKALQHTYRHLHPIPGAIEGVRHLLQAGWQVFILTKPPAENPHCASEKIHWLQEHLPEIGENVIITPDKGCVGGQRDYLIDDHPEWANSMAFKGVILKFGVEDLDPNVEPEIYRRRDTSRAVRDWSAVVQYFSAVSYKNASNTDWNF